MTTLDKADFQLLLDAMHFTRKAFEAYPYESAEFRAQRLREVDDLRGKLLDMKKELKRNANTGE
jgi:hypothetical protein